MSHMQLNRGLTQGQCIKRDLQRGERLTSLDVLHRYGCFRLAARIHQLRALGMQIDTDMHPDGYAVYSIDARS